MSTTKTVTKKVTTATVNKFSKLEKLLEELSFEEMKEFRKTTLRDMITNHKEYQKPTPRPAHLKYIDDSIENMLDKEYGLSGAFKITTKYIDNGDILIDHCVKQGAEFREDQAKFAMKSIKHVKHFMSDAESKMLGAKFSPRLILKTIAKAGALKPSTYADRINKFGAARESKTTKNKIL